MPSIKKFLTKTFLGNFLFSILLMWQYGQYPGRRFPNWDYSWSDAINISRLNELQKGLQNFQIPQMNFFAGLGLEKLSEVAGYVNPANPLNLLLLLDIHPETFILIKTCIFLSILQIGTFKMVFYFTNKNNLATFTALMSATLPVYWSMIYPFSTSFCFTCSIPAIIYIYINYMKTNQIKYLICYFTLILIIGPDLLTTGNIVILNLAFLWLIKLSSRINVKNFFIFCLTGALATISFWFPYIFLVLNRKTRLAELGIASEGRLNFIGYWKIILVNGAHTLLYPIEGSGIQMYTPIFCGLAILFYFFYRKNYCADENRSFIAKLSVVAITIIVAPSVLYISPVTSVYLTSVFRSNFNLIPILVLLVSAIIFSKLKRNQFRQIVICSIGIEIVLYLLDPFTRIQKFLPHGDSIAQTLGTHRHLFNASLPETLTLRFPFMNNQPWLNLILVNFTIALMMFYSTSYKNPAKRKEIFYILSVVIIFYSYSTNIELRRYMAEWQQVSISDYRLSNYELRVTKWVNDYRINESNFRVLLASKEFYRNSGRNIKLLLDSELNSQYNIKIIPPYRELDNIDMGLSLFKLVCPNCAYNLGQSLTQNYPPTIKQALSNHDWFKENSIKYVITADEEIISSDFILLDKFQYPYIADGYDETENGIVYLYEYQQPEPIINIGDKEGEIKNVRVISSGISFIYQSDAETSLKINYFYSKDFRAKFNGKPLKIMRTAENKIALDLPPGKGKFEMVYSNDRLIQSFVLGPLLFLCFIFLLTRRKRSSMSSNFKP